jgi:trans-aconitate 2-methyltransferase
VTSWDPGEYMRFGDERTRPSVDLAARVVVDTPARVIDLGCGPGNSTAVLRARWPAAQVVGLDSSADMIGTARSEHPAGEWVLAGIDDWTADSPFDVVFSNAALQWIPNHSTLVESLFASVASGGALAFQIPSAAFAAVRFMIHDIASEGPWAGRMNGPLGELTMEAPSFYYDHLAPASRSIDIWETEYFHVMDSAAAIVDWIAATGLRPFLAVLESEAERRAFTALLLERVTRTYHPSVDGKVLFPFKRTFVIAYR